MKVGMFSESYKPLLNGVVSSIIFMKDALIKNGNSVYVFSCGKDIGEDDVFYSRKLSVSQGYGPSFPYYHREEIIKSIDIFHTHQPFTLGLYAKYKAKKYNKPLVMTNHAQYHIYSHYVPFVGTWINKFLIFYLKWFMNSCDKIVLPSASFETVMVEKYGVDKDKIQVIPNSIKYPKKFNLKRQEELKKKYSLEDKTVMVYCGRLAGEKNLEFLLNSFKLVYDKNKKVFLFLLGGGPDINKLKELTNNLGIESVVCFTDYIPNNCVFDYLAVSDIFISASKSEIHPITLLEAMYMKLTSVTFPSTGFVDTVEDNINGLLVNNETFDDFSKNILRLVEDKKLLSQMKENAYKKSQEYNIDNNINKLEELYKSLIELKKNDY